MPFNVGRFLIFHARDTHRVAYTNPKVVLFTPVMFLHVYALFTGAFLPLVSASVYPTEPIQETVWSADQPVLVSWIEDGKYPVLSDMGLFDISLWHDTNVSMPCFLLRR